MTCRRWAPPQCRSACSYEAHDLSRWSRSEQDKDAPPAVYWPKRGCERSECLPASVHKGGRTQTDRRPDAPADRPAQLIGRLDRENDAAVAVLRADIHDLSEVEPHRPFLGIELVPTTGTERVVKCLELLVGDAQRKHLAALEADAHATVTLGHQ